MKKVCFLVRDWQNQIEYNYGFNGGKSYLGSNVTKYSNLDDEKFASSINTIRNTFTDVDCFLMPHPGIKVHTSHSFKFEGLPN